MIDWFRTMGKVRTGEWMWRFLALVMLFAVGWSAWIFYQINPAPLITDAAFEAAAKANAKQNAQGLIAPAVQPPPAPKEPPINADKLKLSDTLSELK
jgi:hypothetical protein